MTKTIDSKRRAQLLTDAIAERKAVRSWERGGRKGDRPDTPASDEIEQVQTMPKNERKSKGPRAESNHDVACREAFQNGTFTYPQTDGEIAKALGLAVSSTYHVVNRMVASGELVLVNDRPRRTWLKAAGKPGTVPERETKSKFARLRKVHAVKGKAGKAIHAAHATRGDNGTEYTIVCHAPVVDASKVGSVDDVTCKRCISKLSYDETRAVA